IAPPRPVRPLSVSRVTSQRPTFQWILPAGTTGARVEVCADRCCTRVLQTIDAEGTTVRPMTALPPGVVFWRMFGRRGTVVGSLASYTWEFGVRRRDAPNDTSWGTIRDFNGDGYDDVLVMRPIAFESRMAELWLAAGSDRGLQAPVATGIRNNDQPFLEGVGDFNGDGIADTLIRERASYPSRRLVVLGGPAGVGLRVSRTLDLQSLGRCIQLVAASIVDWNGDGYSDVIMSTINVCDLVDGRPSLLLGYHGSRSGIAAVPQWVIQTDALFTHPAVEILGGLGDLDNDGYGDIYLLNRPTSSDTRLFPERQYIAHGAPGPTPRYELVPDPMLDFDQPPWASLIPYSIGDIDADGFGDMALIGRSGAAFVYRHATGVARPSAILVAPRRGGFADACPSDFNGDGIADMVASSPFSAAESGDPIPVDVGRVYVYFGDLRGEIRDPIWIDRAEQDPRDGYIRQFGASVSCGGDVDGDGFDDVIMTDALGLRLCTRNGGIGLSTAHPDSCLLGAVTIGTDLR
ncbi:MAG: VCBS repeat-containing protein, partial [Rhodoglobus sp.]|nr:VCBS repeat-containing protein [Rhodoglobus sp.]